MPITALQQMPHCQPPSFLIVHVYPILPGIKFVRLSHHNKRKIIFCQKRRQLLCNSGYRQNDAVYFMLQNQISNGIPPFAFRVVGDQKIVPHTLRYMLNRADWFDKKGIGISVAVSGIHHQTDRKRIAIDKASCLNVGMIVQLFHCRHNFLFGLFRYRGRPIDHSGHGGGIYAHSFCYVFDCSCHKNSPFVQTFAHLVKKYNANVCIY